MIKIPFKTVLVVYQCFSLQNISSRFPLVKQAFADLPISLKQNMRLCINTSLCSGTTFVTVSFCLVKTSISIFSLSRINRCLCTGVCFYSRVSYVTIGFPQQNNHLQIYESCQKHEALHKHLFMHWNSIYNHTVLFK